MSGSLRVALAQVAVAPGRKVENLTRIRVAIDAAAAGGARIVVLPEAADIGWTDPSARGLASAVPDGDTATLYREMARRHGLYICGGLVERADDRLYNAALLVDPRGKILIHHRKINELFEVTGDLYERGDRLRAVDTPFGRVGLMICADALAPHDAVGRALGQMGCRILLSPCAWAVPPGHDQVGQPYGSEWLEHYGRLAGEFGMTVIGVSYVGSISAGAWAGWSCIGRSLAMGADGTPLAHGPYGADAEALLFVEIPVDPGPPTRQALGVSPG